MKQLNKRSTRILIAIVTGFLLAGTGTDIPYACVPIDGAAGCVAQTKAIMHPGDLLSNKQNSLIIFTAYFVITVVVIFMFLSALNAAQKKHVGRQAARRSKQ